MKKITPRVVKDSNNILWVGITPNDYQKLSTNLAELLAFIKSQRGVIKYYRACIAGQKIPEETHK